MTITLAINLTNRIFINVMNTSHVNGINILCTGSNRRFRIFYRFLIRTRMTKDRNFTNIRISNGFFLRLLFLGRKDIIRIWETNMFLTNMSTYLMFIIKRRILINLIRYVYRTIHRRNILIREEMFMRIRFFVLNLTRCLYTRLRLITILRKGFRINKRLRILLLSIFLLFHRLFRTRFVIRYRNETYFKTNGKLTFITRIRIRLLFLRLRISMTFIKAFFTNFNVTNIPIRKRNTRRIFTTRNGIRNTLTFRTNIAIIQHANFNLCTCNNITIKIGIFRHNAMTILPIITIIRSTFRNRFIINVSIPIRYNKMTLTFTNSMMLTSLMIISMHLTIIVLLPCGFNIMKAEE